MHTSSIVQNLIPTQSAPTANQLKDGQMIYGKVQKIYSNQTANITIGQTKITAVLDAPISVGKGYWFQVQSSGDVKELKVLQSNGGSQSIKEMAQQLLHHLSLPQSKESTTLAQFFVKNQIPITKENFQQALQWINESGDVKQALQVMKLMNSLSLPFTGEVFKALSAFENGTSLQATIKNILDSLKDGSNETESSLKALLSHLMSTNADKIAEKGLQKLINTWLNAEGKLKDQMFRLLQSIGFFPKQASQANIVMQALNHLDDNSFLVRNPTISQAMQLLAQITKNIASKNDTGEVLSALKGIINDRLTYITKNSTESIMWKNVNQELASPKSNSASRPESMTTNAEIASTRTAKSATSINQNSVVNIVKHILAHISSSNNDIIRSQGMLHVLSKSANLAGDYNGAKQNLVNLLMQPMNGNQEGVYRNWDNVLLQKVLNDEVLSLNSSQASIISNEIKSALKLFGLGFENYLANADSGAAIKESELLTLKPLLMKWLNENPTATNRESAELLLHKITAQQILSQSSGPIQHLLLQLPLSFQRYQTEVVMQWSGRKTQKGEIDPSFCRVLFYLQLENIQETVIDMVVQNKVMNIGVINEHAESLKLVSQPYIQQVKEKLEKIGYQISAVRFELPSKFNAPSIQKNRSTSFYEASSYSGVDLKI